MQYKNISLICFIIMLGFVQPACAMHIKKNHLAQQKHPKRKQSEEWYKMSFLHACMTGNAALVDSLIGQGANVNIKGDKMATPLHIACKYGHLELARFLIKKGADINAKTEGGMTPLHCAVIACHLSTVRYLIKAGADSNVCTHDGHTVLNIAYESKDVCMVALLETLTAGADESGEGYFVFADVGDGDALFVATLV